MKIAVYTRVSTDNQAESLNNQSLYFNDYVSKHPELELYKIYPDKGLTGTLLSNRPKFLEMLYDAGIDVEDVYATAKTAYGNIDKRKKRKQTIYTVSERKPKFEEILLKNSSRFARNTLSFDIISKLREKGVYVTFIEQNVSSRNEKDDFFLKLFQLFDEQDSRDKSQKVRTGILASHLKDTVRTTKNVYGYNYIKDSNSLEIIEDEAKTIRLIYSLYLSGKGFRQIVKHLVANGIYARTGKPFAIATVRRILANERYAGYNIYNKYNAGTVFNKESYPKINEEYEIRKSPKVPAIVSDEDFFKVRELLASKVNHKNQKGIYHGTSKYSQKLFCGICGSVYHGGRDDGRVYYYCRCKRIKGVEACDNKNISEKKIDDIVDYYYLNSNSLIVKQKKEMLDMCYTLAYKYITARDNTKDEEKEKLKDAISINEKKLTGLFDLYALQTENRELLLTHVQSIDKELAKQKELYARLTMPDETLLQNLNDIKARIDLINTVPNIFSDIEEFVSYIKLIRSYDDMEIELDLVNCPLSVSELFDVVDFELHDAQHNYHNPDVELYKETYYNYLEELRKTS